MYFAEIYTINIYASAKKKNKNKMSENVCILFARVRKCNLVAIAARHKCLLHCNYAKNRKNNNKKAFNQAKTCINMLEQAKAANSSQTIRIHYPKREIFAVNAAKPQNYLRVA